MFPVEDLPRNEPDAADPARRSIPDSSEGRPETGSYGDVDDAVLEMRREQAEDNKRWFNDGTVDADSVWADTLWSGERNRTAAAREANARWSELAAAQRTSSVSFGDDPHQLLYHAAEPANTVDRAHAAHYVPRPPERGAGPRDRIRAALAGVERLPVLAPRADREHAVEERVPEA